MLSVVTGIVVAGLLALAGAVLLFALCRFERFVGVRYLARSRPPRAALVGLWSAALVTVVGLTLFYLGHDRVRQVETVGMVVTLVGALVSLLFLLLRTFSVFTTVSTMGVVLGVASLVVVLAVTSGFEREFQEKVLAVNAHLIVTDYGIDSDMRAAERKAEAFMEKLAGLPGLVRMKKFSFSAGEVMLGKLGTNLKGVDLTDGAPELQRSMIEGRVEDLARPATCPGQPWPARGAAKAEDPAPGKATAEADAGGAGRLIIGTELKRKLRISKGDCLQLLVPFSGDDVHAAPAAFPFKVVGVFHLGFHEYDSRLAFVSLEDARRLGNARQSIFGVELRFDDPMRALSLEKEVERRLQHEPRVIDWRTLNHNLFMALTMQKLIIALVLGFIIVVAAFNIVASLMLVVLSKYREIAILSAMGARAPTLLRIFVVAGGFVGFVGTGLGLLYGLLVCGVAHLYGYPLDPKVYLIAQLPVVISPRELLFVAAATQLICFLATLYPALRAARLKVVDGLRYI